MWIEAEELVRKFACYATGFHNKKNAADKPIDFQVTKPKGIKVPKTHTVNRSRFGNFYIDIK